jgi:hypothetical protein
MTAAPATASAAAPIAPAPNRVASHSSADRFAFAAVLDSLPSTPAKADAATAEEQPHRSNESPQEESSRAPTAHHLLPNDSALMASLPFASRAAAMMNERPRDADDSPSFASPAIKTPRSESGGAPVAAAAEAATVGRLTGERAFHLGVSNLASAPASRALAADAPFAPAIANPTTGPDIKGEIDSVAAFSRADVASAQPLADTVPSVAKTTAPPPTASPLTASPAASPDRPSIARAASHEAAHGGQKPETTTPAPVARASSSASASAPTGPSAKAADGRSSDPTPSEAPPIAQTSPFGAPSLASFVAGASFHPAASTAGVTGTAIAPRVAAPATGAAPSTPPVREIDVDLSPGGLEDVSMTMRLAGDKLSVVIRAASSHTLNSIEGARDAIADRMAAIGQPLDSLIVKQAGVNTDGSAAGDSSAADGRSAGGSEQRSAHGAGEREGSNDPLSRRSAGRDRSF